MKKNGIGYEIQLMLCIFLTTLLMQNCCDCHRSSLEFSPPTPRTFPFLEISGTHYQIGYAVGSRFRREIRLLLKRRRTWFSELKQLAQRHNRRLFLSLKAKAEAHFPDLMDELTGMSEGSGIPLDDLFLINIKAEISAAYRSTKDPPGCSTIALIRGKNKWLFHNEDGHGAYRDLMFVVKATPPSGVSFLALCYPGHLMGNGPSMNSHGVFQTTNFIDGLQARTGIPRYFLGRAVLEATSLDDALKTITRPDRAYTYHHNLASFQENAILSVEVTPDHYQTAAPGPWYVHTNHFILETTRSFPQNPDYVDSSSQSRYGVITRAMADLPDPGQIRNRDILKILSSHEKSPYSPCRHPGGSVRGTTLATAVIDVTGGTLTLYKGNPCESVANQWFCVYPVRDFDSR